MGIKLKLKLGRLRSAGPGGAGFEPPSPTPPSDAREAARRERVEALRGLMGGVIARGQRELRTRPAACRAEPPRLPGELRDTPHGPVHLVDQYLEPHHCHGRVPIARARRVDPQMIARLALDPDLADVDPRGILLLDTETTGLSGGTGTLAFLIGIAWFEDESLRIQQLFLRRPGEEVPMLRLLAERIEAASCLVTYNGKAFDWPLIRTRYLMNRVPLPEVPRHLDLLHCARRVFKRRLERVRLVHMEAEVLGMRREQDVDGAEIPGIYLDFIRGADGSELAPVIEHNANDLVALAAILAEVVRRFETLQEDDDPRDHYGYARVAERADDLGRALAFARAAAAGGGDSELTVDALLLTARLARRRGDPATEEASLRAALGPAATVSEALAGGVHLRLAKLYEHRRRDAALALVHARCASAAEDPEANGRRLGRLTRRLMKAPAARRRRSRGAPSRAETRA